MVCVGFAMGMSSHGKAREVGEVWMRGLGTVDARARAGAAGATIAVVSEGPSTQGWMEKVTVGRTDGTE